MPRAFLFDKHGDSTDTADGPRRCTLFTPLIRLTLSNVRKGYSAMRWQLRNQIMLPMVGVMLASLVAVSVLNAFLSVQRTCLRIEREMNEMATTLADANFPLTDGVLSKMRGLSGTEFVIIQQDGSVVASSSPNNSFFGLSESAPFVERDKALVSLFHLKAVVSFTSRFEWLVVLALVKLRRCIFFILRRAILRRGEMLPIHRS